MFCGVQADAKRDEELRAHVVQVANRARETQRRVQDLANELVIARILGPELERAKDARSRFVGTVMGITANKVHVRLDAPPLDLKLYLRDLAGFHGNAWLDLVEGGAALRVRGAARPLLVLGQPVTLMVDRYDASTGRYILRPVSGS